MWFGGCGRSWCRLSTLLTSHNVTDRPLYCNVLVYTVESCYRSNACIFFRFLQEAFFVCFPITERPSALSIYPFCACVRARARVLSKRFVLVNKNLISCTYNEWGGCILKIKSVSCDKVVNRVICVNRERVFFREWYCYIGKPTLYSW